MGEFLETIQIVVALFLFKSIDEVARYDLEATFTKIEQVSGKSRLLYVGHSPGATVLLAYGATFPDKLQRKVIGAVLLDPLVELRNSGSLLEKIVGRHVAGIWKFAQITGLDLVLSYYKYQKFLLGIVTKVPLFMYIYVKGKRTGLSAV